MNTTLKDKNDGDNDHATHSSRDKESSSLRTSPVSILPQVPNLVEGIPPLLNPWVIPASRKASRTTNPIREIVDPILANVSPRDDGKEFLSLAVRKFQSTLALWQCYKCDSAVNAFFTNHF